MPPSFYRHMNKYREVIDFASKIDADSYICAGWEFLETYVDPGPLGKGPTTIIYRLGWPRRAGEPVRPEIEDSPLGPGPSAN